MSFLFYLCCPSQAVSLFPTSVVAAVHVANIHLCCANFAYFNYDPLHNPLKNLLTRLPLDPLIQPAAIYLARLPLDPLIQPATIYHLPA